MKCVKLRGKQKLALKLHTSINHIVESKRSSSFLNFLSGTIIVEIELMVTIAGTMRTVSRTGIGIAGAFIIKMYKKLNRVVHSEHVLTGTTIAVEGNTFFGEEASVH